MPMCFSLDPVLDAPALSGRRRFVVLKLLLRARGVESNDLSVIIDYPSISESTLAQGGKSKRKRRQRKSEGKGRIGGRGRGKPTPTITGRTKLPYPPCGRPCWPTPCWQWPSSRPRCCPGCCRRRSGRPRASRRPAGSAGRSAPRA